MGFCALSTEARSRRQVSAAVPFDVEQGAELESLLLQACFVVGKPLWLDSDVGHIPRSNFDPFIVGILDIVSLQHDVEVAH